MGAFFELARKKPTLHLLYLQQLLVLPGSPGNDRCWQFARRWTEAGHRVTFLSSTAALPPDHPWRELASPARVEHQGIELYLVDVPYSHLFSFPRRLLSFWQFFQEALRVGRQLPTPDAVLAYSAPLTVGEAGRRLAHYMRRPFFFEVADVWPEVPLGMGILPRWLGPWLRKRSRKMYEAARLVFPYSPGMAAQIAAHGISETKIHPIHNGADLNLVPPPAPRPPGAPVHLLYLGTLGLANDVSQYLRALARLDHDALPPFQVTIAGHGNDALRVAETAEALDLPFVTFLPQVPREAVGELLSRADIGLVSFAPFPVLEANAATKFYDYLAAALPVVINYKGWQAELLSTHACGLSAPQGDEAALAACLSRLIADGALRRQMGARGRALAQATFDRRQLAGQMLQLMLEALAAF